MKKTFLFPVVFLSVSAFSVIFLSNYLMKESGNKEAEVVTSFTNETIPPRTIMILGGDVMLGRNVMGTSIDKNDHLYPIRGIANYLQKADIVFVNLENPIINNCPRHDGGFTFCASEEMTQSLVHANMNIVNLANNHSLNYGRQGLTQTLEMLEKYNIKGTGLGKLETITVNNVAFGFLGFDYVSNLPQDDDLLLVENSALDVDVLVVAVHWGEEYKDNANINQRTWAKKFIKAGADIISGHHPHWVQDLECYEGQAGVNGEVEKIIKSISKDEVVKGDTCPYGSKPVYYSTGNLVFDQMWSEETKKGLLVEIIFEGKYMKEAKHFNTYMSNWAQPELVE